MVIRPFLLEQSVHLFSGALSLVPLTLRAAEPAALSAVLAQTVGFSLLSLLAVRYLAQRRAEASIPEASTPREIR
ncbi:hypothetical protein BH24DEI1_BH24DEI1_10660 [soil metagenome]|nr:hypothetical protein [Deinococcota bacterium]